MCRIAKVYNVLVLEIRKILKPLQAVQHQRCINRSPIHVETMVQDGLNHVTMVQALLGSFSDSSNLQIDDRHNVNLVHLTATHQHAKALGQRAVAGTAACSTAQCYNM